MSRPAQTLLEAVNLSLAQAARYHSGDVVAPAVVLWTDADGLVHRAEMRGQGHFMDEHYTDFDAPFTIQSPT